MYGCTKLTFFSKACHAVRMRSDEAKDTSQLLLTKQPKYCREPSITSNTAEQTSFPLLDVYSIWTPFLVCPDQPVDFEHSYKPWKSRYPRWEALCNPSNRHRHSIGCEYSHGPAQHITPGVLAASSPMRWPKFESNLRKIHSQIWSHTATYKAILNCQPAHALGLFFSITT